MLRLISRQKSANGGEISRFVVTVQNDTPDRKYFRSMRINKNPKRVGLLHKVNYTPVKVPVYLVDYLMVVHDDGRAPTVQEVLNAFDKLPQKIKYLTVAFEFHYGFYGYHSMAFKKLEEDRKWVTFVALLSTADTWREAPGQEIKFSRPIGITDKDWSIVKCLYSVPHYDYIEE